MRVFIAIILTEEMKCALGNVIHDMKKSGSRGNFTIPDNMHITLAFIGEVADVTEIEEALDEVEFRSFELKLEGFGRFGSLYWAGLAEQPLLEQLVKNIRRALDDHGIAYDRKKFKAHITVARKVQATHPIRVRIPKAGMKVTGFSLMKSERIRGKLKYTEISSWGI